MKYDVHAIGGLTKRQLEELAVSLKGKHGISSFLINEDFEPLPHVRFSDRKMTVDEIRANFRGSNFPCHALGIRSGPVSKITAVEFLMAIDRFELRKFFEKYDLDLQNVPTALSSTGSVIMYFKSGEKFIPSSFGKISPVADVHGSGEVIPFPPFRIPYTLDHPILILKWLNQFNPLHDDFAIMPSKMVIDLNMAVSAKGRVS